ncbi:hypothetical protein [Nonomuraea sp. NPDC049784]|uniref:hypothetical protein n=1 Tax=Nonomuraea sp. NPDC049784 TaxID=3154361 RepID=UPI0033F7F856
MTRSHESVVVLDATGLRALAHPVRVQLVDLLRKHGPSTATRGCAGWVPQPYRRRRRAPVRRVTGSAGDQALGQVGGRGRVGAALGGAVAATTA